MRPVRWIFSVLLSSQNHQKGELPYLRQARGQLVALVAAAPPTISPLSPTQGVIFLTILLFVP